MHNVLKDILILETKQKQESLTILAGTQINLTTCLTSLPT